MLALAGAACGRDALSDREDLSLKASCDGCTALLPDSGRVVPLLVVLHGNHESASDAARRWRTVANKRGWGVLALQCPRERGCDDEGRWYRWAGHPSWIFEQLEHVKRADRERLVLVGWSGGASYIGMMAPAWQSRFDAIVFHGGGQPPRDDDAGCPSLPAYFLVGDKNPAHPAAVRLRDYWSKCGARMHWDLIEGADHAAEDRALDESKAHAILDWIERQQSPDGEPFAAL
jgi:poly(3-hydroxybutyrate) depolymerase